MALALFAGAFYDARMTMKLRLPNDLAACHAIMRDQAARIAKLEKERDAALQLAFRKKLERHQHDPKQFVLDFGNTPEIVDAAEGIADAALETIGSYERRKQADKKPRNEQLPAHLPRYELKLPVPADLKECPTHGEREVIGYDWQETLEVVPPKLVVRRTGIPKLACPNAAWSRPKDRSVSSRETDTTRAWPPRSSSQNMGITCRSTDSRISLLLVDGRQRGARF